MKTRRGFTLVELIVALVVFTIFLGGIFYAATTELNLWQDIADKSQQIQVRQIVLNRIIKDIRAAKSAYVPANGEGLVLQTPDDRITYSLVTAKVRCQTNGYTTFLSDTNEIKRFKAAQTSPKQIVVYLDDITAVVNLRN